MDVHLRCGMVLPLLGSATGKVFAAFSPPELTQPYLDAEIAAAQHSETATFTSRAAVDAHLAEVRERCLGVIDSANLTNINERGVNGFSAPVFDATGAIVLALTMMGDAEQLKVDDPALARLADAARRLSARLGFKP